MAGVVAFVTSFKFGSWTNYYLEPLAAGCVLTATLVQHGARLWRGWAVVVWAALSLGYAADAASARWGQRGKTEREALPWGEVAKHGQAWAEPVLVEDTYLAVRGGVTPYLANAANFNRLQEARLFGDRELMERLETGWFKAVVTMYPIDSTQRARPFPARWLAAARHRYVLTDKATASGTERGVYVYRRAGPAGERRDGRACCPHVGSDGN